MLSLQCKASPSVWLDAECLAPDRLAGQSVAAIARLPCRQGNAAVPLGDVFSIAGDSSDQCVVIEGDCTQVNRIGARMSSGTLIIYGSVGMHLGAAMTGGEIKIEGNAGAWLGAEMRRGRIHVHGRVDDWVGAAYPGSAAGMRGGAVLIDGSAGNHVGAVMRRGLIAIAGDAGHFTGAMLIAGTILIFGSCGDWAALGMKRGTLAIGCKTSDRTPFARPATAFRPVFLEIYLRQLRAWGFPVEDRFLGGLWDRFACDLLESGKGELLYWRDNRTE
jgi:formylmethanofuran dehydrogenase subunit C